MPGRDKHGGISSPFPNLNEYVINMIASYLALDDLKTCRLLNKKWRNGVNQTFVAKSCLSVCLNLNSEDEMAISNYLTKQQSIKSLHLRIVCLATHQQNGNGTLPQSPVTIHAISFIKEKISWNTLRSLGIFLVFSSRTHLELLSLLTEKITRVGSIVEEFTVYISMDHISPPVVPDNAALEGAVSPAYSARGSILRSLKLEVEDESGLLSNKLSLLLGLGTIGTRRLELDGMPLSILHPSVKEGLRELKLVDWDAFAPAFIPKHLEGFGNLERLTLPLANCEGYTHFAQNTLGLLSPTLKQLELTLGWVSLEDEDDFYDSEDSEDEDNIVWLDPLEDVFRYLPELRILSVGYDFDEDLDWERYRFRSVKDVLLRFPKLEELKLWPVQDKYAKNIFRAFLGGSRRRVFPRIRKITLPRVETWAAYLGYTVRKTQRRFDELPIKFPNAALNWM